MASVMFVYLHNPHEYCNPWSHGKNLAFEPLKMDSIWIGLQIDERCERAPVVNHHYPFVEVEVS